MTIDDYKIIKELGFGIFGTVYLVSKNNKKYALKIEHVLESHLKKNMKVPLWREIEFSLKFANKYPDQFMTLIEYDFIDNCKHQQKYPFNIKDLGNKKTVKAVQELAKSDMCCRKIYSLVDLTLNDIHEKLSLEQIYSEIIQLTYIVYLLHSHNYAHTDLHMTNVGVVKTDKKYINILGHKIPTFGYIYKAIDFGLVANKKDVVTKNKFNILGQNDKKIFDDSLENEIGIIYYNFLENNFWKYVDKLKINIDWKKINKKTENCEEFKALNNITTNMNKKYWLFRIFHHALYQRIILGSKFKKVVPEKLRMPIEDIIFCMQASNNYVKIINYFAEKLK